MCKQCELHEAEAKAEDAEEQEVEEAEGHRPHAIDITDTSADDFQHLTFSLFIKDFARLCSLYLGGGVV